MVVWLSLKYSSSLFFREMVPLHCQSIVGWMSEKRRRGVATKECMKDNQVLPYQRMFNSEAELLNVIHPPPSPGRGYWFEIPP